MGEDSARAVATFASKGHDLFATTHKDRATIDRLWNRFVAAWFEGGKDDPKLALLRLDADLARQLARGIKMLLGDDPKEDYKAKGAEVGLR